VFVVLWLLYYIIFTWTKHLAFLHTVSCLCGVKHCALNCLDVLGRSAMCCYCRYASMKDVIDRRSWRRLCNQREGDVYYDPVSHTSWSELMGWTNVCRILDVLSYGVNVRATNFLLSVKFSVECTSLRKWRVADIIPWRLQGCLKLSSVLKERHLNFRPWNCRLLMS
jgi:hypothetical protein